MEGALGTPRTGRVPCALRIGGNSLGRAHIGSSVCRRKAPALLVAGLLAMPRDEHTQLGTWLSSKVNQWTLPVGSLSFAHALGASLDAWLQLHPGHVTFVVVRARLGAGHVRLGHFEHIGHAFEAGCVPIGGLAGLDN
jgi:hypothetical protein